ncbi:MAG: HD domain-containing protein [bacterium]
MSETTRVEEAVLLASRLHRGQRRKGTDVPYLFHLLAVAALVAEHGGDEDQVVAALLHDAIEDAGGTVAREEIRRRFGEDVAALVDGCTDADTVPKPPWRARKERFVARVADASPRLRLVVAADKLHNADATLRDLRRLGDEVWNRFRGGRDGTLWYYEEVTKSLAHGWSHPILDELRETVKALRAEAERRAG